MCSMSNKDSKVCKILLLHPLNSGLMRETDVWSVNDMNKAQQEERGTQIYLARKKKMLYLLLGSRAFFSLLISITLKKIFTEESDVSTYMVNYKNVINTAVVDLISQNSELQRKQDIVFLQ